MGRVGDAVKVRGMFLHPAQAGRALAETPGLAGFRFVIEREGHRDELTCEVVAAPGSDPMGLSDAVAEKIRSALRFRAQVRVVDEIPEGSVVDDRRSWD